MEIFNKSLLHICALFYIIITMDLRRTGRIITSSVERDGLKMNIIENADGKRVALLGAGISNMPLAEFLTERGAVLTVRDKKSEAELGENAEILKKLGAKLILGDNYLSDIDEDIIFRSPGIRPDIPELADAVSRGKVLTSEMEAFLQLHPCPTYAVTGSDGKSTTTTLISLMLRKALGDERVFLGGNIGEPLLHRYPLMNNECAVAVELSSFQLMTIDAPLESAVITNISPNHLNWHTGMDEYIEAKKRILRHTKRAVLNYDNEETRRIAEDISHNTDTKVTYFSKYSIPDGVMRDCDSAVFLDGGAIWYLPCPKAELKHIIDADDILLPGMHNVENYMAAAASVIDVVSPEQIKSVAQTFGGVRHRLELVREINGVKYYNSSIDSSPTRTAAALSALGERPIVLICGGYDKHIPFEPLAEAVLSRKNVHTLILTGATAKQIEAAVKASPLYESRNDVKLLHIPEFDDAVASAASCASCGDTVLLSPACASFDAFPIFEVRGERFKTLVNSL